MADNKDDIIEWSVRMLQKLKFDGDEDALAAYVDALVDNNRESEGGDLALLETRTMRELSEFLGDGDAASFVSSLMRHLQKSVATQAPVPAPDAAPPTPAPAPSTGSEKPHAPDPTDGAATARRDAPASGTRRANAEPPLANSAGRSRGGSRTTSAPSKVPPRDPEWNTGPRAGRSSRERDGKDSRGFASKESWPATDRNGGREQRPRDRSGGRGGEGGMPAGAGIDLRSQLSRGGGGGGGGGGGAAGGGGGNAGGGDDLRNVLSRSRPTSAKRGYDGCARDTDSHDKALDGRRDDRGGGRGGQTGRNDSRGRSDGAFEPPQKMSRHNGSDSVGQGHGSFGGGGPPSFNPSGAPHVGMPAPPQGVPPPEFFHQMMMSNGGVMPPGFPPPPPGMFGPGGPMNPLAGPGGFAGGGRGGGQVGMGRGGRGRGRGAQGGSRTTSRQLNTILVVRNVPPEKLTLGALNQFFETFGTVVNIQVRPAMNPDHAFVEFAQRSEAQAAMNSVDAILGNRHVRVYWAREQDYEADGISLAGVELAGAGGHSRKQHGYQPKPALAAAAAPPEDPEVVLERKRKEIAAAREGQMKAKAERQAELNASIAKQKELFAKLSEADCTADMKKEILKEIKALGKQAEQLKAKEKRAQSKVPKPFSAPVAAGRPYARPLGAMTADFRPKVVTITDAAADGLSEVDAAKVFRDTVSAKKDGASWVLDFTSRLAAESATRAHWLVTKHFGPEAKLSLSDVRKPKASPSTAGSKDDGDAKETGSTNDVNANGDAMAVESSAPAHGDAPSLAPEPSTVDGAQH